MSQSGKAQQIFLTGVAILLVLITVGCTGQDYGVLQPTPKDLCQCLPVEPDIADYRHVAKHVAIPNVPVQEVTVDVTSFLVGHKMQLNLCYAKILSGPEFLSFSRDRDKGLSKRQSTCETQSRCSRCCS